MVYHLYNNITINGKRFDKIFEVGIDMSIDNFIQSAVITCSKYLKRRDAQGNESFIFNDFNTNDKTFQRGSYVKIPLGYAKEQAKVNVKSEMYFEGFISDIDLTDESKVKITVQDYGYLLKKSMIKQDTKTLTLKEIGKLIETSVNNYLDTIKDIAIGANHITIESAFPDLVIQKFFTNESAYEVLNLLKKNYLLQSFCISNTLKIGANFDSDFYNGLYSEKDIPVFSLYNRELIKNKTSQYYHYIINKSNLKYTFEDDTKLQIVTKCIKSNGDTFVKIYGDKEGNKKQLTFIGDYNEKEIDNLTFQNANKLRYTGFKKGSSFTTYGLPRIPLLSCVSFDGVGNINYLSGVYTLIGKSTYLVTGVKITFGDGAFRQDITLANKISATGDSNAVDVSNLPVLEGLKKVEYK